MHFRFALLVFSFWCCLPCFAQDAAPIGQVEQWYRAGQFQQAAEQGLQDLLLEPWNHELRFIVADSLQRIGQVAEATIQFEALDGTPLASSAALRLNSLRGATKKSASALLSALSPALSPNMAANVSSGFPNGTTRAVVTPPPQPAEPTPQVNPKSRPVSTLRERVQLPPKSPALAQIEALFEKGDYDAVGREGLAVLAQDKNNHELRLKVANSLSWTGFLQEAVVQYQLLLTSPVAQDARIGLANSYRWLGQNADALPLYKEVLATAPQNQGALEGVRLAQRELAPRTVVELGTAVDSTTARRRSLFANHTWRNESGKRLYEVEVGAVNDRILEEQQNERDVTLRFQAQDILFQPKFELSAQGNPQRQYFGSLRLQFGSPQNTLEIGRVNWAKLALNARAFQADLTADHIGVSYGLRTALGELSARFDYFSISDDNEVTNGGLRFVPSWRPLGNNVRFFTGIDMRTARRPAINSSYYAPVEGLGSGFFGVQADFGGPDWSLFGSAQVGARIYGEASNSFSYSVGGKRWLSSDLALGFNLFRLSSSRDNSGYRAKALNVNVEKLWN
jgi:tetratricopeptide (TPR) repeat protein